MNVGNGEELPSLVMVLDVHYLYGRNQNYDEPDFISFCVLHVNPLMKRLYMELLEDCVWDPRWFTEWTTLRFMFSSPILSKDADYIPRSAHKKYWKWSILTNHIWWIENNLGDRGKFRVVRVKHNKHECRR